MNVSRARELLGRADAEPDRLARHLLVAAALRDLLRADPIVVGGTAQEFWTSSDYHQTDLDLCAPVTAADRRTLVTIGFRKAGRHWECGRRYPVAVEFPEARIDGDETRTTEVPAGPGSARVIGLDDLYVDRLRQSTMKEPVEGIEFHSALAIAADAYEEIDWPYVQRRVKALRARDPVLGAAMSRINARIRHRVRALLPD